MCPQQIGGMAIRAEVWPTAARKTTSDADSVASQSQDCRGWRWMLPRFKSSRPDLKGRSSENDGCPLHLSKGEKKEEKGGHGASPAGMQQVLDTLLRYG
jgi:hypothetical protein